MDSEQYASKRDFQIAHSFQFGQGILTTEGLSQLSLLKNQHTRYNEQKLQLQSMGILIINYLINSYQNLEQQYGKNLFSIQRMSYVLLPRGKFPNTQYFNLHSDVLLTIENQKKGDQSLHESELIYWYKTIIKQFYTIVKASDETIQTMISENTLESLTRVPGTIKRITGKGRNKKISIKSIQPLEHFRQITDQWKEFFDLIHDNSILRQLKAKAVSSIISSEIFSEKEREKIKSVLSQQYYYNKKQKKKNFQLEELYENRFKTLDQMIHLDMDSEKSKISSTISYIRSQVLMQLNQEMQFSQNEIIVVKYQNQELSHSQLRLKRFKEKNNSINSEFMKKLLQDKYNYQLL